MRSEYDQEIISCVLCYGLEQTGNRALAYVGLHHEKSYGREGYKVCRVIKVGVSCQTKDEGIFVPYARDMVVSATSKDLCRAMMHTL